MHLGDRSRDREPKPTARCARLADVRAAVEALEDVRQLAAGMPGPVSRTSISAASGVARSSTRTSPPRGVNFSAFPTRLLTSWTIRSRSKRSSTGSAGTALDQRDAALLGELGMRLDHRAHRVAQVALADVEREDARVDARQVEQVVAHPLEAADLLARPLEELARVVLVDRPVALEFGEGSQRGDRRPQLVRHVGDELPQPIAIGPDQPQRAARADRPWR